MGEAGLCDGLRCVHNSVIFLGLLEKAVAIFQFTMHLDKMLSVASCITLEPTKQKWRQKSKVKSKMTFNPEGNAKEDGDVVP